MRIVVADNGPGFRRERVANPLHDEQLETAGGRGLLLMDSYMHRVELNAKGNEVWMLRERTAA